MVGILHGDRGDVRGAAHKNGASGGVPHGALDLFMATVPDEQDFVVVAGKTSGLAMHLRDEWAGRIDGVKVTLGGLGDNGGRDAVSAEHDMRSRWNFTDLVDENRPPPLEGRDHVHVVHNLFAHING
jgi:hypothetical protein